MVIEQITREHGFITGYRHAHLPFAVYIFRHFLPRFFAVVYFQVQFFRVNSMIFESLYFRCFDHFSLFVCTNLTNNFRYFSITGCSELEWLVSRSPVSNRFLMGHPCAHSPFAVDIFRHFLPRFFAVVYFYLQFFPINSMVLESLFFPCFDHFSLFVCLNLTNIFC